MTVQGMSLVCGEAREVRALHRHRFANRRSTCTFATLLELARRESIRTVKTPSAGRGWRRTGGDAE